MRANDAQVTVILNPSSGLAREGASEERVHKALQAAGLSAEVIRLRRGLNVGKAVREQVRQGARAVVAAGGDGTVSTVASALAGTETALGVLPAGTLNHFAKDLNLPTELEEAARVIGKGNTICVDVAEVNGRVFVNNSSIGLYPTMVAQRDILIKRGVPKALATAGATLTALWRFPNSTVRVVAEGDGGVIRTPLVFVGNNRYQFSGMEAGSRARIQDGVLHVCTVIDPSRRALFRAVLLAIIGRGSPPELQSVQTSSATIETFRRHVKVALDGEVVRMTTPLEYSIRPAALKVIVRR